MITDEARHVHYGVLALREHIRSSSRERERREREDWAFEVALLMRNRFLAHEFYDEYYGHAMTPHASGTSSSSTPRSWRLFRKTMFKRIVPNLKRIGLLSRAHPPALRRARACSATSTAARRPSCTAQDLLEDRL